MNCTLLDRLGRSTASDGCLIAAGSVKYLQMVISLLVCCDRSTISFGVLYSNSILMVILHDG